jgi:hypothetical protein
VPTTFLGAVFCLVLMISNIDASNFVAANFVKSPNYTVGNYAKKQTKSTVEAFMNVCFHTEKVIDNYMNRNKLFFFSRLQCSKID